MNLQKVNWLLGLAAVLTAGSLVLSDAGSNVAMARGGGHGDTELMWRSFFGSHGHTTATYPWLNLPKPRGYTCTCDVH